MAGFEFTPMGVVPFGQGPAVFDQLKNAGASDTTNRNAAETHLAAVVKAPRQGKLFAEPEAEQAQVPVKRQAPQAAQPLQKPRDIVKAAKARIREIQREIARAEKLRRELEQLTRLVAAAEAPRLAVVRESRTAR